MSSQPSPTSLSSSRPPVIIAPSLLSCDFARLGDESNRMLDLDADWLHVDVMDGHFVPNITLGAPVVKSLRAATRGFLDCHMMVAKPEQWVEPFAKAGADSYTFHIEATSDAISLIDLIHEHKMKAAVAVKPNTAVESILPYAHLVDMVLIMTVEPGFGGQAFNPHQGPKIQRVRKEHPQLNIQVDGGVALDTCIPCAEAGANVMVAGSSIFGSHDPGQVIRDMRKKVEEKLNKHLTHT